MRHDIGPLHCNDEDKPKGQTHIVDAHPSDIIKIKCGNAELVVWPIGQVIIRDSFGRMFHKLIIESRHESEI